jgi:hypothetical protein
MGSIWNEIADGAERESALWAEALLPRERRQPLPVFSPLGEKRFAPGLESIYEGYLLHYGRPRLFAAPDRDTGILLGDYLYAHGLVRIASLGEVEVVADLAELLSLCAQLQAEARAGDGAAWAATVAFLGKGDGRLTDARGALRDERAEEPLLRLAEGAAGAGPVERALALHADRVD